MNLIIPYNTMCWGYYMFDWAKNYVTPRNIGFPHRKVYMDLPISIFTKFRIEVGLGPE